MNKEANWIFFDAGVFIGAFDVEDWQVFEPDGIMIVGPQSILSRNKSYTKSAFEGRGCVGARGARPQGFRHLHI